jgi:hypothetical protein
MLASTRVTLYIGPPKDPKNLYEMPTLRYHSFRAASHRLVPSLTIVTLSPKYKLKMDKERTPMVCTLVNMQVNIPKMIMAMSAIFLPRVLEQAL